MRMILFLLLFFSNLLSYGQILKASVNYKPFVQVSSCPNNATSFVLATNLQESPTGVWGPAVYVGFGNAEGLVNVSISGDGYFQSDYLAANNQSTAIFLTTEEAPISPFYANVQYGIYVSAGAEYTTAINGSYTGTGVSASAGDKLRVIRTGTTVKAQYYRSSTWTDLYTYTTSSSGTLWMGFSSADPGNAVYCTNPKYCN